MYICMHIYIYASVAHLSTDAFPRPIALSTCILGVVLYLFIYI